MARFEDSVNERQAFAAGVILATTLTTYASYLLKTRLEKRHNDALKKVEFKSWMSGWESGWDSARIDVYPYVDMDHYEKIRGPYLKK